MAKKSTPAAETHATGFCGFGRQYQKAANLLFEADKTLTFPIYFLYSHAIELPLKAYLRAANLPVVRAPASQVLVSRLYGVCRRLAQAKTFP
jgi:hypothetical protein